MPVLPHGLEDLFSSSSSSHALDHVGVSVKTRSHPSSFFPGQGLWDAWRGLVARGAAEWFAINGADQYNAYLRASPGMPVPADLATTPEGPEECSAGQDFGQPCPLNWLRSGAPNAPICLPPPDFQPDQDCLQRLGGQTAISGLQGPMSKERIATACRISWPCKGEYLEPNYDITCPETWAFQQDGTCLAPPGYMGTCNRQQNFLAYTPGMKATWGENCGVSWPLAPPKPLKEILETPSGKLKDTHWFSPQKIYAQPCPLGFKKDQEGICHAPERYLHRNITGCAHMDTRGLTTEMKKALEVSCKVTWPGGLDVAQLSMPPALVLGLAFL